MIAHNSQKLCDEVFTSLMPKLALTIKPLQFFLGMAVTRDRAKRTLTLSQTQYIKDLLVKYRMDEAVPISTPSDPSIVLSKEMCPTSDMERQIMQSVPVRELGGALLFLARYTRPDIAFAVNDVLRYSANPGPPHWNALKRICRYLRGTPELGVTLGGLTPIGVASMMDLKGDFYVFCDADHARATDSRRSTSGHFFFGNGGPVTWHVRYQRSVAKSSTVAEYFAVDDASQDILLLRMLMEELGSPPSAPTVVFEDNMSAIALMKGSVPSDATRHIAIRHFLIRELVENGDIALHHCPTESMLADALTKPLPRVQFEKLRVLLMGAGPSSAA